MDQTLSTQKKLVKKKGGEGDMINTIKHKIHFQ